VTNLQMLVTSATGPIRATRALAFKARGWLYPRPDGGAASECPVTAPHPRVSDAASGTLLMTHPTALVSEFVYFLAAEGHVEALIQQHVRTNSGMCAGCRKPWPCNWCRLTDQALEVRPLRTRIA
jgi:hypothetical protein